MGGEQHIQWGWHIPGGVDFGPYLVDGQWEVGELLHSAISGKKFFASVARQYWAAVAGECNLQVFGLQV